MPRSRRRRSIPADKAPNSGLFKWKMNRAFRADSVLRFRQLVECLDRKDNIYYADSDSSYDDDPTPNNTVQQFICAAERGAANIVRHILLTYADPSSRHALIKPSAIQAAVTSGSMNVVRMMFDAAPPGVDPTKMRFYAHRYEAPRHNASAARRSAFFESETKEGGEKKDADGAMDEDEKKDGDEAMNEGENKDTDEAMDEDEDEDTDSDSESTDQAKGKDKIYVPHATVPSTTEDDGDALALAAMAGNFTMTRFLLEMGARPNESSYRGISLVEWLLPPIFDEGALDDDEPPPCDQLGPLPRGGSGLGMFDRDIIKLLVQAGMDFGDCHDDILTVLAWDNERWEKYCRTAKVRAAARKVPITHDRLWREDHGKWQKG